MPGRAQEKEEEDVVSFLNMSGRPAPRFLSEDPRVAVSVIDDVEKKLTKVCDKSGTAYIIVHLHHKDRLCVMGIAELWVCRGSVHVLGYDAQGTVSPRFLLLNSAPYGSVLSFEGAQGSAFKAPLGEYFHQRTPAVMLPVMHAIEHVWSGLSNTAGATLVFKQYRACARLDHVAEARGWFTKTALLPSGDPGVMHGFGCMLPRVKASRSMEAVVIPPLWESSVTTVLTVPSPVPPTVLLCGAKNVGKSTLARYVVNRFLSLNEESTHCAYLDTDIGQTEFTPPGFVSLVLLHTTEPMLGPALPFWRKPVLSYYLGDVSPRDMPNMYTAAIFKLIEYYQNTLSPSHHRLPLVVNTQGWVKGMGLELLNRIIHGCRPQHILQIVGESAAKKFTVAHPGSHDDPRNDCRIHVLAARKCVVEGQQQRNNEAGGPSRSSRAMREEKMVEYFSFSDMESGAGTVVHTFEEDIANSLAYRLPFKISWNAISISFQGGAAAARAFSSENDFNGHVLQSLNGTLVGLGIVDGLALPFESSQRPTFTLLKDAPLCRSIGLGIIRGIDVDRRLFFIVTPVPINELVEVNIIIRGSLNCPVSMLQWRSSPSEVPYTSFETIQPRARQMTSVRGMKRKRLDGGSAGEPIGSHERPWH